MSDDSRERCWVKKVGRQWWPGKEVGRHHLAVIVGLTSLMIGVNPRQAELSMSHPALVMIRCLRHLVIETQWRQVKVVGKYHCPMQEPLVPPQVNVPLCFASSLVWCHSYWVT